MQRSALIVAIAAIASGSELHDIALRVNRAGAGWRAEAPARFNSTAQAAKLCGTWLRGHPKYERLAEGTHIKALSAAELPASLDARVKWANCSSVHVVRDQSSCGSCWAFGSTETFEDRQCIHRGINVAMSTEDTAACCSGYECGFSNGCNGGQPSSALRWMTEQGVVSGGLYGDKTTCQPYSLPPCAHHVPASAKYPTCPSSEYSTPKCKSVCQDSFTNASFVQDKHKGTTAYSVSGVEKIMTALQDGPLSAAFTVYEDFVTYKSGVYKHTTGSALGGHAVQIVGYGTEDNQDYWLVKNSWNEEWGDAGYFKILKGQNECGIESDVAAIDF